MGKNKKPDSKSEALSEQSALNRHPERVTDPLFQRYEFFDPGDLVQVKYEMLRRALTEGFSVTKAAEVFGFSRPAFYKAQSGFEREGLPGLVPKKRGPHGAYKLTPEVVKFIQEVIVENPSVKTRELIDLVKGRFDLTVHRRTLERALVLLKKKRL